MRETQITLPELALVAATRAALGGGLGLLLAERLSADQRKAVGWTLLLVGALTTIPLAFEVLGKPRPAQQHGRPGLDRFPRTGDHARREAAEFNG